MSKPPAQASRTPDPALVKMQLPSPPSSVVSSALGPQMDQQRSQMDSFLNLLQGPAITVVIGSGPHASKYHLPIALLCTHSQFFRTEILSYDAVRARLDSNKKRKLSVEEKPVVTIKKEDDESEAHSTQGPHHGTEHTAIRLADVDPTSFGLFLKFVYTGYYPAIIDAPLGVARSVSSAAMSKQHDMPYTLAKAAMPPPANINFRQTPPRSEIPPSPSSSPPVFSYSAPLSNNQVPPSIHAYLLSLRLGAAAFMNQALHHIYYGIGKYFALTPSLLDYIWNQTSPTDKLMGPSPLRRLILDVLVVHWPFSTTHIILKHPALHTLWNDVFDKHRDLRHVFTMGLQGTTKVLPVQAYFVSTAVFSGALKEELKEQDVEVMDVRGTAVDTSAAETVAVAATNEQRADGGGNKA